MKGLNFRKLAGALAAPGLDTRFWLSMGVVATVNDQGEINATDPAAVIVGPEGVEMDVVLLPSEDPITCRFPSGGSSSTNDWPINPGDEVLVAIPEGLPGAGGVILGVLNSAADQLPVESDGKPMFRHDRRLIWANGIPIDLRTGNVRLLVDPAGTITLTSSTVLLGGPDAGQALVLGTSYRAAEKQAMTLISTFADTVNLAIAAATGPSPVQKAAVLAAQGALKLYIESVFNQTDYLSDTSKTK